MPFPPKGLKSQEHPLKHRFDYSFGLSAATTTQNSAWVSLVRHSSDATVANAKTILVHPDNSAQDVETGPLCTKMSIIQNMTIMIAMSKSVTNNFQNPFKLSITPFFASFPEKYDVLDTDTAVTVQSVMQLTKTDPLGAQGDVVPLTTNKLPVDGNSDKSHPLSTVNLAEAFDTTYNMTTNATMEDTPFNMETLQSLLHHGSANVKGALKAVLGRTRHYTFTNKDISGKKYGGLVHNVFIKKFVPRAIRRVVDCTYFGLLFHVPVEVDIDSYYADTAITASKSNIGIRVLVRYDEWNEEHDNGRGA